ncbi:DUF262 domain-containing protein [Streptomonospora algeriensis]|uniref:DUF262 domain-containing protein n=1 Tax=Streptomonospora algeriensis TaxID=995084 RepID=A0ABW3BA06_9ACTN
MSALVDQISKGEIKLPEIQRAYVWKPTQVAKLVDSLYRGYPSGSLLFWKTEEAPQTHAMATAGPAASPAVPPLYLLDGQQRLTSLHRVLTDHPEAQIVFNVETEAFQNQSAATAKDPRWIKVHDVLHKDTKIFPLANRLAQNTNADADSVGECLHRLRDVRDHEFHMEILSEFPYNEIAEIFVRVNSGRSLKISDLALSTLSARWPGVVAKLEAESEHWAKVGYQHIDVTFLTRALTGAVLGRGLSTWSHAQLVKTTDEELEQGWATVRRGLRDLIPRLQNNLGATHSTLLPSMVVLLPLIVLLGERPDEPLDKETADGILYWFLIATVRNHYSSSTDTKLGQDIPAVRREDPVRALLTNLGIVGSRIDITPQALAGRTVGSPYFFLSFLAARRAKATDWWHNIVISAAAEGGQKLQYHHIHPQATLRRHPGGYAKNEINDIANLAFISGKANQKISNRSPAAYFPELGEEELRAHFVPLAQDLRSADSYREFLAARRVLLADAMNALVNEFRPAWLDDIDPEPDAIAGATLEFTVYDSPGEQGQIAVRARYDGAEWSGSIALAELEAALAAAFDGLGADVQVAGETVPVKVESDSIEIPIGPFLVTGDAESWKKVLEQEKDDPRPLSEFRRPEPRTWPDTRTSFPVTSID